MSHRHPYSAAIFVHPERCIFFSSSRESAGCLVLSSGASFRSTVDPEARVTASGSRLPSALNVVHT